MKNAILLFLLSLIVAIPKVDWDNLLLNEQKMMARDFAEVYGQYHGCSSVSMEAYEKDNVVLIHYDCAEVSK